MRCDQILDAANALFAERGYEEVTVEDIAKSAGVTRPGAPLLRRTQGRVPRAARRARGRPRGFASAARGAYGPRSGGGLGVTLARLDRGESTIYLGTIAPGEDLADPEVRRLVGEHRRRAVMLLASFHADIAHDDSPRLHYALECWTGLNRAATRRWLRGEATREATQELLATTLEHVLRTFGALPRAR